MQVLCLQQVNHRKSNLHPIVPALGSKTSFCISACWHQVSSPATPVTNILQWDNIIKFIYIAIKGMSLMLHYQVTIVICNEQNK